MYHKKCSRKGNKYMECYFFVTFKTLTFLLPFHVIPFYFNVCHTLPSQLKLRQKKIKKCQCDYIDVICNYSMYGTIVLGAVTSSQFSLIFSILI